jgi:serine phosphatase RsbU (regulator of sigma subunit)
MFGIPRLYHKLQLQKKRKLADACEKTIETLHSFGQETAFKDDITLLGIEYLGNDQTPDES